MARKIYCAGCATYLGEINKASLKKGMSYLCGKCESARKLMMEARKHKKGGGTGDIFGDIFG